MTQFGVEANADQIGLAAAGVVGTGVAAHAAVTALKAAQSKAQKTPTETTNEEA